MEYLSYEQVVEIHEDIVAESGGSAGIRDAGALSSCVEQPQGGFGDFEYYPTIAAKAAILCFLIAENHPFVDGNKRTAHASMETFLGMNGYELNADVDESEQVILALAASQMTQEDFMTWVENHVVPLVGL